MEETVGHNGGPPLDPLLDTDQLASEIGCTPQWLEKLRCEARGADYVKIGRLVRYRRSAVDRWLAENTFSRGQITKAREPRPRQNRPPSALNPRGDGELDYKERQAGGQSATT